MHSNSNLPSNTTRVLQSDVRRLHSIRHTLVKDTRNRLDAAEGSRNRSYSTGPVPHEICRRFGDAVHDMASNIGRVVNNGAQSAGGVLSEVASDVEDVVEEEHLTLSLVGRVEDPIVDELSVRQTSSCRAGLHS